MMVEGEATPEPAEPVSPPEPATDAAPEAVASTSEASSGTLEAESPPAVARSRDWSHLRGFQTVEAPAETAQDYADELVKELQARAARFAQSVDESIVLSSEGLIRWLGDPIARVVSGEALLKPHAVLLADEALIGEDREKVETRLRLWIEAHLRKVIGPLIALSEGADLSEVGKAVAGKVAEALGVLDRDRVRSEVRSLDQTARGSLRKLGVRFGSLYIYVPALLKPGARSLCSLLWTLRRGSETGADRLLAFASAGRTSFANEGLLSPDAYRVAGFRLCGERVVRVDIIERLSDLIRAALPDHMRFGSRPPSEAYGFLVTPQMTSLTGCSGEAFASILRSLGFESASVSKASYEAAHVKAPIEPVKATPSETASAEAGAEAETVASADEPETAEATAETAEPSEPTEDAATKEAASEPEAPAATTEIAETSPPEAPVVEETAIEPMTSVEAIAVEADLAPEASASEPVEEPEAAAEAVAAEPEMVEVWRPAPRRPRAPPSRPQPQHHGKPRDGRRHGGRPPETAATTEPAPAEASAEARPHREEAPRRFEPKGKGEGRPRDDRRPQKDFGPRREPRGGQIDPDSPFAKLAALKPLLERRDKRT